MYTRRTLLGYLGAGIAATGALWSGLSQAKESSEVGKSLPSFTGATDWINTAKPITVADLKGNVVLIHIWTFACINCQRTIPYVVDWSKKYTSQGLKVVGIHTPEFAYEREIGNIKKAIANHGITYPNAVDNQFALWKAYNNQYWPHLFLADRQGRLRYDHIGEGEYDTTERMISTLLRG